MLVLHAVIKPRADAVPGDPRNCAVAKSINASRPEIYGANVDLEWTRWGNRITGLRYIARTKAAIIRRVQSNDQYNGEWPPYVLEYGEDEVITTKIRKLPPGVHGPPSGKRDGSRSRR